MRDSWFMSDAPGLGRGAGGWGRMMRLWPDARPVNGRAAIPLDRSFRGGNTVPSRAMVDSPRQ
ncbi:hypothetical protein NOCA110111 [metagenome]|uniref:Uncharacterized protein n=1 Tax=metagenome TaxID=256318 RepID=A0A2P2C239_9ZZZZ